MFGDGAGGSRSRVWSRGTGLGGRSAKRAASAALAVFAGLFLSITTASAQYIQCNASQPTSAPAGGSFGSIGIFAYGADARGLPDREVVFSSPASGPGTEPRVVTLRTDENGNLTYTPTANSTPGSFTLTITSGGLAVQPGYDCSPSYVIQAGAPASIEVASGSGQTAQVGTAFPLPLAVRVEDSNGNPTQGVTVTFSPAFPGPSASLSSTSAVTDANGIASVQATANGEAGSYTVSAAIAGAPPVGFPLTNTPPTTVTSVSPASGPTTGGSSVTITGTNFTGASGVTFGGAPATSFTVVNATTITATTPAHAAGPVNVAVTTPSSGTGTLPDGFTYFVPPPPTVTSVTPNNGPLPGGTPVTITGTNFTGATSVTFGGTTVTSFTVVNATTIATVTPDRQLAAPAAIIVTTPAGASNNTVSFTYDPPTITVSPETLSDGMAGVAYPQTTFTATGGFAPHTFSVSAGMPPGMTFNAGTLSGAPTAAGTFNFTVTATDGGGFTGSRAYTLLITAPTITVSPPALPNAMGNAPYGPLQLSASGGAAPYTFAVAGGALPAGLTLDGSGSLSGTPTAAGTFNFVVSATDANGFTGSQSYTLVADAPTIAVDPAALPSGVGGVAYGPHQLSASGGTAPYALAVTGGALPAGITLSSSGSFSGTPTEAGSFPVTITATDVNGSTGSASYTLVIDAPVPAAPDRTVDLLAGTSATVSLTDGATGSPFTNAAIVTPPPAAMGTASVSGGGGNFDLVFASTAAASGSVVVTYTLSNSWGTSAPATVTFNIVNRPDPSKDPEVIGLITAQLDSARRLAENQIENFHDRLEQIRDGEAGSGGGGVQVGFQQDQNPSPLAHTEDPAREETSTFGFPPLSIGSGLAGTSGDAGAGKSTGFWTGGFVNFGSRDGDSLKLDQTLVGVSAGFDYRFTPWLVAGIGFGYGRDAVDIGVNGTENEAQALSAAVYGTYSPAAGFFLDGILGYSWLDFDSSRYVTATGDFADGERDGHQVFASLSAVYEHRRHGFLISPYARLDAAWSRLDAFSETEAGPFSLSYGEQDAEMIAGVLGFRVKHAIAMEWGALTPRLRFEYTHDFAGSSRASLGYADLSGLPYALEIDPLSFDYLGAEAGVDADFANGWSFGLSYRLDASLNGSGHNHGVGLKLSSRF